MTGPTIIDLDRGIPETETGVAPRLRVPRPVLVIAILLAALSVIGPANPPAPPLRLVLAANGTAAAAFELGADSLYTASYGVNNPNSESGVRRFDLSDGALLWATALPQGVQNLVAVEDAGVVMARSGTDPRVSFLDTGTGAVLWRLEAVNTVVVTVSARGALISTSEEDGTELLLADPRSGMKVWSRRLPPGVSYGPDELWGENPERIVAIASAGSVTTLDLATGALLSQGDLGGRLLPGGDRVHTVGSDRLVLSRWRAGVSSLSAYSLTPFARLWSVEDQAESVTDCGPVWCVVPPSLDGLRGVDPATGEQRWQTGAVISATPLRPGLLGGLESAETPRITLVDPDTGAVVRQLGEYYRVGDLLVHTDVRAPREAWVAVLDASATPRVLGRIDTEVPFGCEARGNYLACPTTDGPTKVWRVPTSPSSW